MTSRNLPFTPFLNLASNVFNISTLRILSGVNQLSVLYHAVSDEPLAHIDPIYRKRSVAEFRSDLEAIARHYDFVGPDEYKRVLLEDARRKVALLTFDDGLVQCHDVVMPILREMGIPAVFFVNPDFLENREIFYRYQAAILIDVFSRGQESALKNALMADLKEGGKYRDDIKRSLLGLDWEDRKLINHYFKLIKLTSWESNIYLTNEQVNKLLEQGFYFGGHGMKHRPFWSMTEAECLEEVGRSVDYCLRELRQDMKLFCFPFYDFDRSKAFMLSLFSDMGLDLSFGSSGPKIDVHPQIVQRLDMEVNRGGSERYLKESLAKQAIRRLTLNQNMARS